VDSNVLWFCGWVLALIALFTVALRLPEWVLSRRNAVSRVAAGCIGVMLVVATIIFANVALTRHDEHFDLTRERVFTPDPMALEVIRSLESTVRVTYFFRADDPESKRAQHIVELLGQANPFLQVTTIDPDTDPSLAQSAGVKVYNAALLEAKGRRMIVHSTNEIDIAIGIQRVLREQRVEICFFTGHGEYPSDNYEFHTHVEKLGGHGAGHAHGATDAVIETVDHGIGRLRRSLEALGFEIRVIIPAVAGVIERTCRVVVDAGPQSPYSDIESAALAAYLKTGGSALLMYDLGFQVAPEHAELLARLGLRLDQGVVVDPGLHYASDHEMVAVTAYESHPVTERMSFSFYPGIRSLQQIQPADGITTSPLFYSSKKSYRQSIAGLTNQPDLSHAHDHSVERDAGPHLLAAASAGSYVSTDTAEFRAIVIGDADFATNSFYPYMSNNRLALAMVRWLAREAENAPVAARIPVRQTVELTNLQQRALLLWLVVGLPGAIASIGVWVWWRRR
jgi:hypothetical protein